MAREFERRVVAAAIELIEAILVETPTWILRPGRHDCGQQWSLVQSIYGELTGRLLPELMPPNERRMLDAVLKYPDGSHRVLEIDESQHFNSSRSVTLRQYGPAIEVSFPITDWMKACERKRSLEGGGFAKPKPPLFPGEGGRHLQRAFRDALADVVPFAHGFLPTARIAFFEDGPELLKVLGERLS